MQHFKSNEEFGVCPYPRELSKQTHNGEKLLTIGIMQQRRKMAVSLTTAIRIEVGEAVTLELEADRMLKIRDILSR